MCLTHTHKTRVVINTADAPVNGTASQQKVWIDKDKQVSFVQENFLDDINFDFDGTVWGAGSLDPLNSRYVTLLVVTTAAFHRHVR